ncbi:hypothetical protein P170DRAFT_368434 [Aspergillus steynii IBT 23096]|uniref:Uncharacterized protein n=1 Tax=Aspergillus steynii IBT 23096 TaxID=1392250 RepID=A0A2I2FU70_9EURO|nr:uncharacterized protein P170DRAFT_368434 [Aspergillus steynii IBT 23096]PLB44193.1 hypothetical protein P170DRAFT_368434 [Aspergillus steynii IBT 23096]
MVLEVGYSEGLGRLRVDCRWWLSRSEGQVKIALLLSIDSDRPYILIEKWENTPPIHGHSCRVPRQLAPQRIAAVTVALENSQYVVTGAPLHLSIDDIVIPPVPSTIPPIQIA